jgi:hypothetical protein
MIQWYINSRPVPKAIARVHLENAMPYRTAREIASAMNNAMKNDEIIKNFFIILMIDFFKIFDSVKIFLKIFWNKVHRNLRENLVSILYFLKISRKRCQKV